MSYHVYMCLYPHVRCFASLLQSWLCSPKTLEHSVSQTILVHPNNVPISYIYPIPTYFIYCPHHSHSLSDKPRFFANKPHRVCLWPSKWGCTQGQWWQADDQGPLSFAIAKLVQRTGGILYGLWWVYDVLWRFTGCLWWFLMAHDGFWMFMMVFGCFWMW